LSLPLPPTPEEYLPRILGTRRSGEHHVTELVIVGRDQTEALAAMLALFRDHKVELFGLDSQSLPETKHFVITAFVGLKSADCSLEALLSLLRNLLAVESAKGTDMVDPRYEGFLFPVMALDGTRLVITSTENLTQVERAFSKLAEEKGNLVLFATGRQSGLALTRAFRRSDPGATQQAMLATAEDEVRTSGWGLVSFDVSRLEKGYVSVVVTDPIIISDPDATESWMTYGLCAGLIEGIFGMAGHVGERSYSVKARELKFKLTELSIGRGSEAMGA
jgi:hypothetical protein